ncbi:MAG TPA: 2-phosphosulfolactate phosphatase [Polyangiaceae bacterium]|nr:2-phosphosulfolactate phosphatase [Polyangiaceae bacterium]
MGAIIYPHAMTAQAGEYGARVGAEVLLGRGEAVALGKPGLSPGSFNASHAGKKYVLCSLNGALCSFACSQAPLCLLGAFVNAQVTIEYLRSLLKDPGLRGITLIACGETWHDAREDESKLRPCLEDLLCAGQILSGVGGEPDCEATVAIAAYQGCAVRRNELIRASLSGRELIQRGYAEDVAAALTDDSRPCVVKLERDHFVPAR